MKKDLLDSVLAIAKENEEKRMQEIKDSFLMPIHNYLVAEWEKLNYVWFLNYAFDFSGLAEKDIARISRSLGCETKNIEGSTYLVIIPTAKRGETRTYAQQLLYEHNKKVDKQSVIEIQRATSLCETFYKKLENSHPTKLSTEAVYKNSRSTEITHYLVTLEMDFPSPNHIFLEKATAILAEEGFRNLFIDSAGNWRVEIHA